MVELKFEKAIQRLEKIVDDLEKGELDIDRSLEIFEEGIEYQHLKLFWTRWATRNINIYWNNLVDTIDNRISIFVNSSRICTRTH